MRNLLFWSIVAAVMLLPGCKKEDIPDDINSRIFYAAGNAGARELFVYDPVTRQEKQLSALAGALEMKPVVSKGGYSIAFIRKDLSGNKSVYVLVNGSGIAVELSDAAGELSDPAFSPGGNKMAYVSTRDLDKEIYVSLSPQPDPPGSDTRLTNTSGIDEKPGWSFDGNKIAFVSERDNNREVYITSALAYNPVNVSGDAEIDDEVTWSPVANELVFTSTRDGYGGLYLVGVIDPEPPLSPVRIAGTTGRSLSEPAWSPDGKRIAFVSSSGNAGDIMVVNRDGSGLAFVTNSPDNDHSPFWSPDGKKVGFIRGTGDQTSIFTANIDGTAISKLFSRVYIDDEVTWSQIDDEVTW